MLERASAHYGNVAILNSVPTRSEIISLIGYFIVSTSGSVVLIECPTTKVSGPQAGSGRDHRGMRSKHSSHQSSQNHINAGAARPELGFELVVS